MHSFTELVDSSASFTLEALDQASTRVLDALQTSAATPLVRALQAIRLQKVILAVGMFSIFEAMLQDALSCKDGFKEAGGILHAAGATVLKQDFENFQLATNVLKHGVGRSYDALVQRAATLPFRIKLPDQAYFFEGDVSELSTLIEVDDKFVRGTARVISDVSKAIRGARPDVIL